MANAPAGRPRRRGVGCGPSDGGGGYAQHSDLALLGVLVAKANEWFANDVDYPARWEPSGADFLSPALTEAELMGQLLPSGQFAPAVGDG